MTPPSLQSPKPSGSRSAPVAWRIRFVPAPAPTSARVLANFQDPVSASAVAEPISPDDFRAATPSPDQLDVLITPDARDVARNLLAPSSPTAPLPLSLKFPDGRLSFTPGRAILGGDPAWTDAALPILAEFAFYESQLRQLESALPTFESAAVGDVAFAYRPAEEHKSQWDRLGNTMEQLARLRLTFARLEPKLLYRDRSRDLPQRRVFARLCRAADIEDRMEVVTNRLEACEDLYEGAIDRIRDHRWYRKGQLLEIAIVILLSVEVIQIAIDLIVRLHSGR